MDSVLAIKLCDKWQQRDVPRPLDGQRQSSLMLCAGPGLATGTDLAAVADVSLQ
jgi:hypothetical protein